MTLPPGVVDQYFAAVTHGNTAAAVGLAVGLADEGFRLEELCTELVSHAQIEVGNRWHRNDFSVADEHAATAVSDTVVSVLTAYSPPPPPGAFRVAVACAEGEWHALPARLVAEALRAEHFDVTFLGASMPSAHLRRHLDAEAPDVLALSCSTALAFDGVLSCTAVAHELGVPVLAGGRAFGASDRRARVLGADLWCADAAGAVAHLGRPFPTELAVPTADVEGATGIESARGRLVEAATDHLGRTFAPYASYNQFQKDRTREDFSHILDFARASILTRDPTLFDEFLEWLATLLAARQLPPAVLELALAALRDAAEVHAVASLLRLIDRAVEVP
jgi:methanogenic corrinoid protein MtbC1